MDEPEFDRLLARAGDPNLIPAIYNYCDRRCQRCVFTGRCFSFREQAREASARSSSGRDDSWAAETGRSLERSFSMLEIIAKRMGVDLSTVDVAAQEIEDTRVQRAMRSDPLLVASREYTLVTWRILAALRPLIDMRGDAAALDAADTCGYLCGLLSGKIARAIFGSLDARYDAADRQSDVNGSVKVARIAIDESRRAWSVLMEAGRAAADGVPARLVGALANLDAGLAARFPAAMTFVRPGFDDASEGKEVEMAQAVR